MLPYNYNFGTGGVGYQVTDLGSGSMDIRFVSLNAFQYFTLMLKA